MKTEVTLGADKRRRMLSSEDLDLKTLNKRSLKSSSDGEEGGEEEEEEERNSGTEEDADAEEEGEVEVDSVFSRKLYIGKANNQIEGGN